jgi:hypothetical protein
MSVRARDHHAQLHTQQIRPPHLLQVQRKLARSLHAHIRRRAQEFSVDGVLFVRYDGAQVQCNIDELGKGFVCPHTGKVGLGVLDENGV